MVKFILIKSPDEWANTKQACRDELVVYLFFSPIYIYIYFFFVCVCVAKMLKKDLKLKKKHFGKAMKMAKVYVKQIHRKPFDYVS